MTLTLTQLDTGPTLTGTVSANITGATLVAHIRRPDRTVLSKTPAVTNALTGAWSVDWAADDLNTPGTYYVEVQVTFAGGKVQTFAVDSSGTPIRFTARAQIA